MRLTKTRHPPAAFFSWDNNPKEKRTTINAAFRAVLVAPHLLTPLNLRYTKSMYAHLFGPVAHLGLDHAVIDCHGVGYLAYCTTRTLSQLSAHPAAQAAKIYTRMIVREDAMLLYGFADTAERDLFDLITTVSGLGPRLGLSLLSSFTPDELVGAIQHNQPATLARASGVGKKLAEKIIVELKDKVGSLPLFGTPGAPSSFAPGGVLNDLVSALTNLGYQPKIAEAAASAAIQETPDASFELLFRAALKHAA